MADNKQSDKAFAEKALYDIDFVKGTEWSYNHATAESEKFDGYAADHEKLAQEAAAKQAQYAAKTGPIEDISFALKSTEAMAKYSDPKDSHFNYVAIAAGANKVLDNLVEHGLSDKMRQDILAGKKPEVDLDGSKKTRWGRFKNKVKNFLKPNNPKKAMEENIAKFMVAMAKNPDMVSDVKYQMSSTEHETAHNFKDLAAKRDRFAADYNSTKAYWSFAKDRAAGISAKEGKKAESFQSKLQAIGKVRDDAGKKIDLKRQARRNVGIVDAQKNSGRDVLAEKAEKMKNMTPQQRLAMRMSEMKGRG